MNTIYTKSFLSNLRYRYVVRWVSYTAVGKSPQNRLCYDTLYKSWQWLGMSLVHIVYQIINQLFVIVTMLEGVQTFLWNIQTLHCNSSPKQALFNQTINQTINLSTASVLLGGNLKQFYENTTNREWVMTFRTLKHTTHYRLWQGFWGFSYFFMGTKKYCHKSLKLRKSWNHCAQSKNDLHYYTA